MSRAPELEEQKVLEKEKKESTCFRRDRPGIRAILSLCVCVCGQVCECVQDPVRVFCGCRGNKQHQPQRAAASSSSSSAAKEQQAATNAAQRSKAKERVSTDVCKLLPFVDKRFDWNGV